MEEIKSSMKLILTASQRPGGCLGLFCLNWKNHSNIQEVRPDARQIKDPLDPEFSNSVEPQKKGEKLVPDAYAHGTAPQGLI